MNENKKDIRYYYLLSSYSSPKHSDNVFLCLYMISKNKFRILNYNAKIPYASMVVICIQTRYSQPT